jgi:hypothetical protein
MSRHIEVGTRDNPRWSYQGAVRQFEVEEGRLPSANAVVKAYASRTAKLFAICNQLACNMISGTVSPSTSTRVAPNGNTLPRIDLLSSSWRVKDVSAPCFDF